MLNHQEKEELSFVFEALDTDKNGWLSLEELKDGYCKHMGVWLPENEIEKIFIMADTDKNNQLDWNEFLNAAID